MESQKITFTPRQLEIYRSTAQQRRQQDREQIKLRHQRAWEVARQGAKLLKEQFGATKVILRRLCQQSQTFSP